MQGHTIGHNKLLRSKLGQWMELITLLHYYKMNIALFVAHRILHGLFHFAVALILFTRSLFGALL